MKIDIDSKLGARLREKRILLHLSIDEVATELNISSAYLGLVERGRRSLDLEQLNELMLVLQTHFEDLVDKEELFLEQQIRDSFDFLSKDDLKIVLAVCNSIKNSQGIAYRPEFICVYKQ